MQNNNVQSIVIVGGGTAGWMAAASLQQHFKNLVKITLIESSEIGTIGVGEATIPTIRRFYYDLGMNDLDVMRATRATCKLGIQFNDWYKPGSSFIHPFGLFGQDLKGIGFHHFWLKLKKMNAASGIGDYSLGVSLAQNNKFNIPSRTPPSSLSVFDWALHFDASLFAAHMREFATARGTIHIDAKITQVNLNPGNGFIDSLTLNSGAVIEGDLFLDCSGFRGLLIEEALHTGYENWSQWLWCDSAYAVQSRSVSAPASYTKVTARPAGWQWQIPLQHRDGNGHVFSSRYMDDDAAKKILLDSVKGELLTEPRKIVFVPGRRRQAWNKNCIAIGLSSGFLEPLESTSIALVETAIEKIKMLFPDKSFNPELIEEFNEMTREEYERVRDFIILHYKLSERTDDLFWRDCSAMDVPDSLRKKMALFKARGHFIRYRWEMFQSPSWLAIYSGFNYLPDDYDLAVDTFNEEYVKQSLAQMRQSIQELVDDSLSHEEFIAQFCAVKNY